jgi:hypothetical protein
MHIQKNTRAFSLVELSAVLTIFVIVGAVIGSAASFFGNALLDNRLHSRIQDDMVKGLQMVMRDCYAATNVVPAVGGTTSDDYQFALRIPYRLPNGDILTDRFEFVVYKVVEKGVNGENLEGLIRELYRVPEALQALDPNAVPSEGDRVERLPIKQGIDFMRIDYGGGNISQVSNMSIVGDLGIYLSGTLEARNNDPIPHMAETYIQVALRNRKALGWRIRTEPGGN